MFGRDNAPGWGDNRNNYGFQVIIYSKCNNLSLLLNEYERK